MSKNGKVNLIAFEVVNKDEQMLFGNECHQWNCSVVAKSSLMFQGFKKDFGMEPSSDRLNGEISIPSTPTDFLKSISKSLIPNKKRQSSTKKRKFPRTVLAVERFPEESMTVQDNFRRQSREPAGWSWPKKLPTKAKNPVCRGCNMEMERGEQRVRNKHLISEKFKFPDVHCFHVRAECLWKQPVEHWKNSCQKMGQRHSL